MTPRTKAIVPVHLFGNLAPVAGAARPRRAGDRGRRAGGRGRALGGVKAGALGDAATFSFFPSKNLPCLGDGGAIVTDDDELAESARILRFHGSRDKRTFTEVGWNSRLDELQAAVLRVLLPELDGWIDRRRGGRRGATSGWGSASTWSFRERSTARGMPTTSYVVRSERELPVGRGYYRTPVHRQPAIDSDVALARHRGGGAHQLRPADGHGPHRGPGARGRGMRVWVDLTNSPHVLVMRPLIEAMRADGHEVEVTARDFAQTLELCDRFGIEHTAIGRHQGERLASKATGAGAPERSTHAVGAGAPVRRRDGARVERHERRRCAASGFPRPPPSTTSSRPPSTT